jgi:sugar phosphate isomerase/epimerase
MPFRFRSQLSRFASGNLIFADYFRIMEIGATSIPRNLNPKIGYPMQNLLNRRDFMALSAFGLASAAMAPSSAFAAASRRKIPVGVQLYSVRQECEKDLAPVLAAIGKMGYKGVEYAGYYKRDAKTLRKLQDDNGLFCCGTHTGLDTLTGDKLKATIEFNQILGNKFLICPGMSAKDKAGWLEKAKQFNEIAATLKAQKMFTGYHAHGGDFQKFEGETAWDLFFGNTRKEVIMQLDTGNTASVGVSPVEVLKKYPGRAVTIHLKEDGGTKETVIGGGNIKWNEVFSLCEAAGTTQWYIVEHERGGPDPVGDIKRCLEALKGMGKA